MLLRSPWAPRLADIEASIGERLVLALADDIIAGPLQGGDRLPAHRDLAWKLGVGLGTVTKAYATLERRGLIRSIKGRGTFVAIAQAQEDRRIDLSANAPPAMLSARLLARTLTGIARKIDADHLNLYAPPVGHFEHRRVLARWLETSGITIDPSHLVLTSNARQAVSLAFDLTCDTDAEILTERVTYPGAIALARRKGYRMRGVPLDAEGLVPDALAHALADAEAATKIVYVTPTLHNPTTATMGLERRRAIVDVCRRAGARIVEDGVYATTSSTAPALITLAPDIVLHVNGLSKSLGPGLRVGVLALPAGMIEAAETALHDLPFAPSALSCAVIEEWLASDVIESIQRDLAHEARRRVGLANSLLAGAGLITHRDAYHAWLPMPRNDADALAAAAARAGVSLTPPGDVMVECGDPASGVRLCLGSPSLEDLTKALTLLAGLLHRRPAA